MAVYEEDVEDEAVGVLARCRRVTFDRQPTAAAGERLSDPFE